VLAEVKRLHSPDAPDLVSWRPDTDEFAILVQIIAGPQGSNGEESFDVTVCSSAWIARMTERVRIYDGRHHLIVAEYNYEEIRRYIADYVSSCQGSTWQEIASKIGRLGYWEFEDYQAQ
jgi:Immunity protein 8